MNSISEECSASPRVVANVKNSHWLNFEEFLKSCDLSTSWRIFARDPCRTCRESDSILVDASFRQFYEWISGLPLTSQHPFSQLPKFQDGKVAVYADYKYIVDIFKEVMREGEASETILCCDNEKFSLVRDGAASLLIDWAPLCGRQNVDASTATFWLGSRGAHTPLHYDSYGLNVVVQLVGVKRWRLWKPATEALKPLRIPYEESSVYSEYDPLASSNVPPDLDVLLCPGDVLVVPKHWWHFVSTESDVALSMNMWQCEASDARDRCTEAVARLALGSIIETLSHLGVDTSGWLAPSESGGTLDTNDGGVDNVTHLDYLMCALADISANENRNRALLTPERVIKAVAKTILQPDVLNRCVEECLNDI